MAQKTQKKQAKKPATAARPKVAVKPNKAAKAQKAAKPAGKPRQRTRSYEREIEQLVERGKKEGKLPQEDIFALIPDTPGNIDTLDNLYAELVEAEVEVIPQTEPDAKNLSDEWAADE